MSYKILVVDDEKDVVDIVKNRLVRENYEVSTAFDGEEALFKVKEVNPDLIILDLMMPKLNGFEVLQALREKFSDKWRPVIIISANGDMEALKKSYKLEADLYLTKPCSLDMLLKGIKTMISLLPSMMK